MNFWQAISMGSYLLAWYTRASSDGIITQAEIMEGMRGALEVAGVDIRIEVPAPPVPVSASSGGRRETDIHESGARYVRYPPAFPPA